MIFYYYLFLFAVFLASVADGYLGFGIQKKKMEIYEEGVGVKNNHLKLFGLIVFELGPGIILIPFVLFHSVALLMVWVGLDEAKATLISDDLNSRIFFGLKVAVISILSWFILYVFNFLGFGIHVIRDAMKEIKAENVTP